jgi:hypothetical protein
MNIQPPRPIPSPLVLSEWISTTLFLKKTQRRRERRRGDRDDDERQQGAKQWMTHAPGIEENQNMKWCRNMIRARAGEMAVKRETMVSTGERPSGGGVNPVRR